MGDGKAGWSRNTSRCQPCRSCRPGSWRSRIRACVSSARLHILGGELQGDAVSFGGIGGQHTHAAAIGDDEHVVALHRRLAGEGQGAVEEVVQVRRLDDAGLLEGGTVDLGSTGE